MPTVSEPAPHGAAPLRRSAPTSPRNALQPDELHSTPLTAHRVIPRPRHPWPPQGQASGQWAPHSTPVVAARLRALVTRVARVTRVALVAGVAGEVLVPVASAVARLALPAAVLLFPVTAVMAMTMTPPHVVPGVHHRWVGVNHHRRWPCVHRRQHHHTGWWQVGHLHHRTRRLHPHRPHQRPSVGLVQCRTGQPPQGCQPHHRQPAGRGPAQQPRARRCTLGRLHRLEETPSRSFGGPGGVGVAWWGGVLQQAG